MNNFLDKAIINFENVTVLAKISKVILTFMSVHFGSLCDFVWKLAGVSSSGREIGLKSFFLYQQNGVPAVIEGALENHFRGGPSWSVRGASARR